MRLAHAILGLSALGLTSPLVQGQAPGILFRDGDPIIGVGGIERIDYITIHDSGSWFSLVQADAPGISADACLLRSGFLTLRQGMRLPAPANSVLSDFKSVGSAPNGDLVMGLRLRIDTATREGLFWNLTPLLIQEQAVNLAPLPAGTIFKAVTVVRVTSDRTVLCLGKVDPPNIATPPTVDTLFRFRLDALGNVVQSEVLGTRSVTNDVLGVPIETIGATTLPEHSFSANRHGDFVLPVAGLGRRTIMKNMDTIVAQELLPAPVPNRTWNTNPFALSKTAINDRGDIAYTGTLAPLGGDNNEPTNFLIVYNDQKFAQSGDVIPALSTSPLDKSTANLAVTNRGDVYWRASPVSTTAGGAAFMRNHDPLIQASVSTVEGNLVTTVAGGDDCFAVSPEGRFFLGRVVMQSVGDAVIYFDFGLVTELPGCFGNQGSLRHLSGEPRIGQEIRLGVGDGPFVGALPGVFFSRNAFQTPAGCGVNTSLGELMVAAPSTNVFFLPAWDGVNSSVFTFRIPNSMALVDATFYAQGLFGNPSQISSFRLTNALKFEIGPP
jgi:hypothetical protein